MRILILRFCTNMLTAVSFETRNGTMMSACFIVGLMNSSYAGLTKRLYCSRTSTTVLPLSAMSLLTKANLVIQLTNLQKCDLLLRDNRMSSGVNTKIFMSIMSRNLCSTKTWIPSKTMIEAVCTLTVILVLL